MVTEGEEVVENDCVAVPHIETEGVVEPHEDAEPQRVGVGVAVALREMVAQPVEDEETDTELEEEGVAVPLWEALTLGVLESVPEVVGVVDAEGVVVTETVPVRVGEADPEAVAVLLMVPVAAEEPLTGAVTDSDGVSTEVGDNEAESEGDPVEESEPVLQAVLVTVAETVTDVEGVAVCNALPELPAVAEDSGLLDPVEVPLLDPTEEPVPDTDARDDTDWLEEPVKHAEGSR